MVHDDFLDWSSKELFKASKNEDGERVPWGSIRLVQFTLCGVKYATNAQEKGQEGIQLHDVIPLHSACRGRLADADRSAPGKAYPTPLAINPARYIVDKGIIHLPQDRHHK